MIHDSQKIVFEDIEYALKNLSSKGDEAESVLDVLAYINQARGILKNLSISDIPEEWWVTYEKGFDYLVDHLEEIKVAVAGLDSSEALERLEEALKDPSPTSPPILDALLDIARDLSALTEAGALDKFEKLLDSLCLLVFCFAESSVICAKHAQTILNRNGETDGSAVLWKSVLDAEEMLQSEQKSPEPQEAPEWLFRMMEEELARNPV